MDEFKSRVAYLQGLAEGLNIDTTSPEGRILGSVIDVLAGMAEQLADLAEAQEELADYVEDIDNDLGALQEAVSGYEGEGAVRFVQEPEDARQDETLCPQCGEPLAGEYQAEVRLICPSCGNQVSETGEATVKTEAEGHRS